MIGLLVGCSESPSSKDTAAVQVPASSKVKSDPIDLGNDAKAPPASSIKTDDDLNQYNQSMLKTQQDFYEAMTLFDHFLEDVESKRMSKDRLANAIESKILPAFKKLVDPVSRAQANQGQLKVLHLMITQALKNMNDALDRMLQDIRSNNQIGYAASLKDSNRAYRMIFTWNELYVKFGRAGGVEPLDFTTPQE